MLFMQEGQWDWAHAIWEKGARPKDIVQQIENINQEIRDLIGADTVGDASNERLDLLTHKETSRLADLTTQRNELKDLQRFAPTDMPFKGDAGKKYLFRQIIKHAVQEGYDSIGWTTGEQQAARYDLSKHLSEIRSAQNWLEGNYHLQVRGPRDNQVMDACI